MSTTPRYSETGDRIVERDEVDVVLDDDLPPGFDPDALDPDDPSSYLDPVTHTPRAGA